MHSNSVLFGYSKVAEFSIYSILTFPRASIGYILLNSSSTPFVRNCSTESLCIFKKSGVSNFF
ncbi:Uncharacterised protein [Chlamydia trachomatis]|nr:Uncharacterised protein [Chlamydia trachomatis]